MQDKSRSGCATMATSRLTEAAASPTLISERCLSIRVAGELDEQSKSNESPSSSHTSVRKPKISHTHQRAASLNTRQLLHYLAKNANYTTRTARHPRAVTAPTRIKLSSTRNNAQPVPSLLKASLLPLLALLLLGLLSSAARGQQPETAVAGSDDQLEVAESAGSSELALSFMAEERDDINLMSQPFDYHSSMPVITKRELANAIKQAQQVSAKRLRLESSAQMEAGSTGWLANAIFHKATLDSRVLNQTSQALTSEEATRQLAKQYKLNRLQTIRGLPLISVDQTNLGKLCPRAARTFNCVAGQYRSLTGHCNNVQNPDWGAAQTPLVRYAPPRYLDNVARPLTSARAPLNTASGASQVLLLPSARAVSVAIHRAQVQGATPMQHAHMTTLMSFFGQFVFHDLAYVSQFSSDDDHNSMLRCCNGDAALPPAQRHPECMPIELRDPEENYCLDYVRSTPAVRAGCNLGARDQMNLVTSYLDGSAIYGSSEEQLRRLRTFTGGRLRSQRAAAQSTPGSPALQSLGGPNQQLELLPQIKTPANLSTTLDMSWAAAANDCRLMAQMRNARNGAGELQTGSDQQQVAAAATRCFQAGDNRVNENLGLALMHTIWLREHNQVADKLSQLNKHWRDERLFEEARRIVVAELQHITYNEFLPSIIGEDVMDRFNLSTLSQGYAQSYDPQLNAGMSNEVAAAAFPFILSTIPSSLERYSDRLEMLGTTSLADTFMDGSDLLKRNRFGQYLMGMMSQSAMEPALGLMPMTQEMTPAGSSGRRSKRQTSNQRPHQVDIVALTLQLGRDHGLKPYLYWRQVCQLKPVVRNWQTLAQVMPSAVVEKLRTVYQSVEQLDLYLAVLETPLPGASLGPTFVCLLARQFFHLKHGDRYWYENDLPGSAFTPRQLEQIRQTSLAKLLCRNGQSSISFIQPAPLLTSDPYLNAYQYCTNKAMAELDLSKWRQPLNSAQLAADGSSEEGSVGALTRAKRLAEDNQALIEQSVQRAKRQVDAIVYDETVKLRRKRRQASDGRKSAAAAAAGGHHHHARYMPRLKRQTLKLNNQSLIFELATNEVVRTLLNQGKDREHAQSIQSDIRDFLLSLESIQLDNLLDNSGESARLHEFIASAGGAFLTADQRTRLQRAGDTTLFADPLEQLAADQLSERSGTGAVVSLPQRTSSVSANCQDDDRAFPCDHTSAFRTITGWCNNLNNPKFGQSFTPLDRLLANAYEDGLAKPRQFSVRLASLETGERAQLPSARLVSTTMHDDTSRLHPRYSLALMQFGQFGVDHDLTRTPFSVALDGSLLDCSPCDSRRTVHRDCHPIEIPANDAHFNSAKARAADAATTGARKCLHFVRSLNGQTALGPRQQINALTAYFDGSEIYGSDNCEAKSLRAFVGGRLNSSTYMVSANAPGFNGVQPKEILPITTANPECVTPNGLCFHAGDQRASEQPGLTAIHTIFMRLHNSIVGQLAQVNRHWNDEKLYQHGRRIVSAIMQRISYGEFAPRLLGLDYMSKFDLLLKNVGYSNDYDESCSATILTEFSAAAFRMGHSLIRAAFPLLNKQYQPIGKAFQLRKAFFNSQRILTEPNLIDSILRGVVSTPIETLDNSVTEELTNHLFERPKAPFSGMDLISLNIQRARDHGIPGYNAYRAKCNLTRAKSFDQLSGEIPANLIKRLSSIYASVDDIDLFTGGMSELPVHGGIIGPTLGCIIGMQFARLKKCDRFWHETNDPWVRFSATQLAEVRKMTLAKVICQESDNIDTIQRQTMDVYDQYLNPRVACSSLPSMDLSAWRENQKSCSINKLKLELGQSKRINPCKSCTCTLEGPVCRTAKINCLKAMKQANLSSIMADKSCLVQCAWALDMQPLAN